MSRLQHKKGRKSNYVKRLVNNPDWEEAKRKIRIREDINARCAVKTSI